MKIFGYLSLPDLMKLRRVSKRWRKMVTTTAPLEVLDLSQYSTTIDNKALIAITDFAGSRPRVIDISGCFHITDEGFSHMVNEIGIGGRLEVLLNGVCMGSHWYGNNGFMFSRRKIGRN